MVFQAEKFKTQADSNRILKEKVFPPRGLIFDTNDEIIVDNFIRQDLVVTPNFIEDYSLYLSLLSELVEIEKNTLEQVFFKKLSEIEKQNLYCSRYHNFRNYDHKIYFRARN